MEFYDSEEAQIAALKDWWKANGQSAMIGLAVGIAIILGWNFWQDYQKDRAKQASVAYSEMLKLWDAEKLDSVVKSAERIMLEFKDSDYASYSGLLAAKAKVQQNDLAGAKKLLETVAAEADKGLANIAKIRLIRLMMANKEFEQALKFINGIDPAKTNNFSAEYDELVGDLYVALDRPDQARTSYQSAVKGGLESSPMLQMKLDDLTAPEKIEAKP